MGFFGATTVQENLLMHQMNTGKIVSGTLNVRGANDATTAVAWGNIYLTPIDEVSHLGSEGAMETHAMATLWRVGETTTPRADHTLTVGSKTWLINSVVSRLNADESSNFCVYDCQLS